VLIKCPLIKWSRPCKLHSRTQNSDPPRKGVAAELLVVV
jgi:hypothetical protein